MTDSPEEKPQEGEIIQPLGSDGENSVGDNYFALISQFTERPDLLIETLEKHDPGFIKRMNERAESGADRMRTARFWFGGFQAYSGLLLSIVAALAVVGVLAYSVINNHAGFWLIIGLGLFYAITQSGTSGFLTLCHGVADLLRRKPDKPD